MARKNERIVLAHEQTCRPLDTYDEIISFLDNPPTWRSLCKEMTPHSKDKIRNMSLNTLVGPMGPDRPPTFCHFSPDDEDVDRHSADSLPKTLVCHDMANGYHDDSVIDGTSNHKAYTFSHWAGIDIFCYFSHHLITIPPLGWINVGHAHGVKVIGTIITEWSEGYDFWEFVLSSESQYQELALALVSIAKVLKFDGWLLNVENKITKPLVLVQFVKYFHEKLHEELDDPVLVWYDSVTIKGNLNWQNGLNEYNKDFFDVCDAFFTNYSWKESDVATSVETAGDRLTDLFIGIDVWGRNFYGGGQFNTAEALELASSYGCSVAIFAPAWTHETADRRDADISLAEHLDARQHLLLRERALWGSLWPFLHTSLPCALPFQTSFCQGSGVKRRLYGEVLSPGPWYNLRHMQYQPNAAYGPHGYVLSTPEKIHNISRTAITRDKKGIIKYHPVFEHNRHELLTARSARELEELHREHHDSLVMVTLEEEERRTRAEEKRHSKKNVFKQIFRLKSRRRSEDDDSVQGTNEYSHDQVEKPNDDSDITNDQPGTTHDQPDKTHDQTDKTHDQTDKTHDQTDKTHDQTDKTHDQTDKTHDQSDKTNDSQETINEVRDDKTPDRTHIHAHVQIREESHDELHRELNDKSHEAEHSAHSWYDLRSGWSMRQLSINLKLGSHSNKTRLALACVPGELPCLEPYYEDSYIGGSCLCVHPSDPLSPEHRWTRLFHCEFPCAGDLVVCVVTKALPDHGQQYLDLKLFARDSADEEVRVTCVGRALPGAGGGGGARAASLYPLVDGPDLKALQKYLLLNEPGFYMSPENSYGWKVRYYIAPLGSTVVTSINLHCGLSSGPLLLGYIGLCLRREGEEVADNRLADERPRPARPPPVSPHTDTHTSTSLQRPDYELRVVTAGGAGGVSAEPTSASPHTMTTSESQTPDNTNDSKAAQAPATPAVLVSLDKSSADDHYKTDDNDMPMACEGNELKESDTDRPLKDLETDNPMSSENLKTVSKSSQNSQLGPGCVYPKFLQDSWKLSTEQDLETGSVSPHESKFEPGCSDPRCMEDFVRLSSERNLKTGSVSSRHSKFVPRCADPGFYQESRKPTLEQDLKTENALRQDSKFEPGCADPRCLEDFVKLSSTQNLKTASVSSGDSKSDPGCADQRCYQVYRNPSLEHDLKTEYSLSQDSKLNMECTESGTKVSQNSLYKHKDPET